MVVAAFTHFISIDPSVGVCMFRCGNWCNLLRDPQFDIILLGVALLNDSSTEIEEGENCTGGDQLAR